MTPTDDRLIWDLWISAYRFAALTAAEELGLFGLLPVTGLAAVELAEKAGISSHGTAILCDVLVASGFLERSPDRIYRRTGVAEAYLVPGSPTYWGDGFARGKEKPEHKRLVEALRGGSDAHLKFQGKSFSEMWAEGTLSPEAAATFTQGMHSSSFPAALGAARSGAFDGVSRLLDVGGGSGAFGIAHTTHTLSARATLFDLPPVCEAALRFLDRHAVRDRVTPHAGNFWRDPWPAGHDGVLFSNVLHDWPMAGCEELLRRAFDCLPSGGAVLVHEMLCCETEPLPLTALLFSLLMFINHSAQGFTAREIASLLERTGFKRVSTKPTFGYFSVVRGTKP
jgi:acetylserotonin N-methyltransferase